VKPPLPASEKSGGSIPAQRDAPATHDNYHAFLVRLWRDSSQAPWRASLQDAVTGQRQAFSGIEGLIGFLLNQVDQPDTPVDGASGMAEKP
jgi:hypothetical protein